MFDPTCLQISKIDITKFDLSSFADLNIKNTKKYEMTFDNEVQVGFNPGNKASKVAINYKVGIISNNQKSIQLVAQMNIDFIVEIKNFDELVKLKDKEFDVDNRMYVNLIALCYSTGRGIIYSKLLGTYLGGIIIPVVDPLKLIKEKMD